MGIPKFPSLHSNKIAEQEKLKQERDSKLKQQYGVRTRCEINALSIKGMHIWLLQGPYLVKIGKIPPDMFFAISSFLLKLPFMKTMYIYEAVHANFFRQMVQINKKSFFEEPIDYINQNKIKFFSFCYSKEELAAQHKIEEEKKATKLRLAYERYECRRNMMDIPSKTRTNQSEKELADFTKYHLHL